MYIKKIDRACGEYLIIAKSVWDPVAKNVRTETVRSLGSVKQLEEEHGDAMAYAQSVLLDCEAAAAKDERIYLSFDPEEMFQVGEDGDPDPALCNDEKNLGYGILQKIYRQLDLDRFWQVGTDEVFSPGVEALFRYMVFCRVLVPDLAFDCMLSHDRFFEPKRDFQLEDLEQMLLALGTKRGYLIQWMNIHAAAVCPGDPMLSTLMSFDDARTPYELGSVSTEEEARAASQRDFIPLIKPYWEDIPDFAAEVLDYVAVCILRLLQRKLEREYRPMLILKALRNFNCVSLGKGSYKLPYFDAVLADCGKALDMPLGYKYRTREQIVKMLLS